MRFPSRGGPPSLGLGRGRQELAGAAAREEGGGAMDAQPRM